MPREHSCTDNTSKRAAGSQKHASGQTFQMCEPPIMFAVPWRLLISDSMAGMGTLRNFGVVFDRYSIWLFVITLTTTLYIFVISIMYYITIDQQYTRCPHSITYPTLCINVRR